MSKCKEHIEDINFLLDILKEIKHLCETGDDMIDLIEDVKTKCEFALSTTSRP